MLNWYWLINRDWWVVKLCPEKAGFVRIAQYGGRWINCWGDFKLCSVIALIAFYGYIIFHPAFYVALLKMVDIIQLFSLTTLSWSGLQSLSQKQWVQGGRIHSRDASPQQETENPGGNRKLTWTMGEHAKLLTDSHPSSGSLDQTSDPQAVR